MLNHPSNYISSEEKFSSFERLVFYLTYYFCFISRASTKKKTNVGRINFSVRRQGKIVLKVKYAFLFCLLLSWNAHLGNSAAQRSQQIKKNVVDVFPLMLRPTGGISFYHPYDSSKRNANFDEIDRYGFQKRNFDEIDRYGFKKRNFDEIDRYGFKKRDFDDDRTRALRDYLKRGGRLVPSSNFDEIDRSGFNAKRFDEIDRWGMPMSG